MKYLEQKGGAGPREHKSLGGPRENKAAESVNATDAAVALAEEAGIDLSSVKGSGDGGRITKADVQASIDAAK